MWLPVAGLLIGLLTGFLMNVQLSSDYAVYLAVAILTGINSLTGGIKAHLQKKFDDKLFISGFFTNIILAAGLAFLGSHIGVDLYLAAIFAFGVRIFHNTALIRRLLFIKWEERKNIVENDPF